MKSAVIVFFLCMGVLALLPFVSADPCGSISSDTTFSSPSSSTGATTCFSVTGSDIIIDCAGYSISGNNAFNSYAFQITSQENVTIRNCAVTGYDRVIYANNTNYSTFRNFSLNSNVYGVDFDNSNHNIIDRFFMSGTYTGGGAYYSRALNFGVYSINNTFANSEWNSSTKSFPNMRLIASNNRFVNISIFQRGLLEEVNGSLGNNEFENVTMAGNEFLVYYNGSFSPSTDCPSSIISDRTVGGLFIDGCEDAIFENIRIYNDGQSPSANIPLWLTRATNITLRNFSQPDVPASEFGGRLWSVVDSTFSNLNMSGLFYIQAGGDTNTFDGIWTDYLILDNGPGPLKINDFFFNSITTSGSDGMYNYTFTNGTISATSNPISYGSSPATYTLVNVTWNADAFVPSGSKNLLINQSSYLRLNVSVGSSPASNAGVYIVNQDDDVIANTITDANGFYQQVITQYILNSTDNTTQAYNYTINVSHSGYEKRRYLYEPSQNPYLNIRVNPTVCIVRTQVCYSFIQAAMDNAIGGDTIMLTWPETFEEALVPGKDIIITSNGSGLPTLLSRGFTLIDHNNYDLELSRVYVDIDSPGESVTYSEGFSNSTYIHDSEILVNDVNRVFWLGSQYFILDNVNITMTGSGYVIPTSLFISGTPFLLINNTFINATGDADIFYSANINVLNSEFYATDGSIGELGDSTFLFSSSFESAGTGLRVRGSAELSNVFMNVSSGNPLSIEASDVFLTDSIIATENSGSIILGFNSQGLSNVTIQDSTIITGGTGLVLSGYSSPIGGAFHNITILNVTGDTVSNSLETGDQARIIKYHYIQTNVSVNSVSVNGSRVLVVNESGGIAFDGETNEQGYILTTVLGDVSYIFYNGSAWVTNITNHNYSVGASYLGYQDLAQVAQPTNNIWLNFPLDAIFACNILATSTCLNQTKLIGLQGNDGSGTNAHAQNYTLNTYANSVCCRTPLTQENITNECSGGVDLIHLSSEDNAHVELNNYSSYSVNACLKLAVNNLSCSWKTTSCDSTQSCILSVSDAQDAHVGACGDYSYNLCCNIPNTAPSIPELLSPTNGTTSLTNRYVSFDWNDSVDNQSDTITYELNISAPDSCAVVPGYTVGASEYTSIEELCVDQAYNWSVRACDSKNLCSNWSTEFTFTVPSVVSVNLVINTVNFGTLEPSSASINYSDDTLDNAPLALRASIDGNVDVNMDILANTPLWTASALDTEYFQFAPSGSSSWINFSSSYQDVTDGIVYGDTEDIEIRVQIPVNEPSGEKSSTVQVLVVSGE